MIPGAPWSALPPSFATERLVLRAAVPSDAAAIFAEYASDDAATRFLTWKPHRSPADTEAYLARCAEARAGGRSGTYALVPAGAGAAGAAIGALDLRLETPHRVGFGFVLGRRHWGKGLMPEALAQVVGWALGQPVVWRTWAVCDADNAASARTMEKAGLRFEGRLRRHAVSPNIGPDPRDHLAYARVRGD